MNFKVVPINMITSPNDYGNLPNGQWVILSNAAATLWFQLNKVDIIGERRYIPQAGSTMQVIFPRADTYSQPATGNITVTQNTITKTASPLVQDNSIFSFAITGQDASNIVSGSVKFNLTIAGVSYNWIQNYVVKKLSADVAL